MKHWIVLWTLAAAVMLMLGSSLGASWSMYPVRADPTLWYTHQNAVFMRVDYPVPGSWGQPTDYFAGWAFNCNGSQPEIIVWRYNPVSGIIIGWPSFEIIRDVQVVTGVYRPDVVAAYVLAPCNVTPYSGFHVYFPNGHPLGVQNYLVQGYSEGGTWNPQTGAWVDASHYRQFFVVVQE